MNYTTKILTLAAIISCYSTSFAVKNDNLNLKAYNAKIAKINSKMAEFASFKTSSGYIVESKKQKSAQEALDAAKKDVTGKLQQKGITDKEKDELNKRLESLTKGGAPEFIALKEANAALSNFESDKKKEIWALETEAEKLADDSKRSGVSSADLTAIPHQR